METSTKVQKQLSRTTLAHYVQLFVSMDDDVNMEHKFICTVPKSCTVLELCRLIEVQNVQVAFYPTSIAGLQRLSNGRMLPYDVTLDVLGFEANEHIKAIPLQDRKDLASIDFG